MGTGVTDVGIRATRRLKREVRRRVIGRRLRVGDALRPGPSWVQIGIMERCNYRCAMCWPHSYLLPDPSRRRAMTREAFTELVTQIRDLGAQRLDIAGMGEPLLHPDALDMLAQVKAAGIRCVLITNGSLLTRSACDRFLDIGLDTVNVSLNAATDETHHQITRGPMGDRSRIVSMLRYLVEERSRRGLTKPWVSISFVVQRGNCAEIARAAQEAMDIGLDCVLYMALGINEASREVVLSQRDEEEALRQMAQAQRVLSHAGRVTNAHHYLSRQRGVQWSRAIIAQTPCYVGQFFCRIHTDGAVDPCGVSRRIVGDITRERIRDIWSSPLYRAFRQEASSLPQRGRPLDRCGCYTCNHAQTILSYHQRLSTGLYPEII